MLKSLITRKNLFSSPLRFSHTTVNKICETPEEALAGLRSGSKVLFGGFGICGIPENLIKYLAKSHIKDIWCFSNTCGIESFGLGMLLKAKKIKRFTASYVGENREFERQYLSGELEVEFCPQGTLAERFRAGAMGIPAFYTPTGRGTYVETGGFAVKFKPGSKEVQEFSKFKEKKIFEGKHYILEQSIKGDFALIKAWKADTKGNLFMRKTAKNFNVDMAGAAEITVAEVEEIVEPGQLDANHIHVPGIFVDRIYKGPVFEKRHEKLVHTTDQGIVIKGAVKMKSDADQKIREKIAKRAARELENGMYVNLGIGIPVLVPSFLPEGVSIELQSENGVLGIGPYPREGEEDSDLINAGKESITVKETGSFFASSLSFGMYRGQHLNATILGAMQISSRGDIANWIIPGKLVKGMGGAMDLVMSGSKVVVCMEHTSKNGNLKILERCTLPLTGVGVVKVLITDMAVFTFDNGKMYLKEVAHDYTLEDVIRKTGCEFIIPEQIGTF